MEHARYYLEILNNLCTVTGSWSAMSLTNTHWQTDRVTHCAWGEMKVRWCVFFNVLFFCYLSSSFVVTFLRLCSAAVCQPARTTQNHIKSSDVVKMKKKSCTVYHQALYIHVSDVLEIRSYCMVPGSCFMVWETDTGAGRTMVAAVVGAGSEIITWFWSWLCRKRFTLQRFCRNETGDLERGSHPRAEKRDVTSYNLL